MTGDSASGSDTSSNPEQVLSFLSFDELQALGGLPPEGIVGTFAGERSVETFRANPTFVSFLHDVIRAAAPADPDFQEGARHQGEGWLYLIDGRTPEGADGAVPPEDIIGAFQVRNGVIVDGSYQASAAHRVYTANGLVQVGPYLRAALVKRLPRVSS